MLYTNKPFTRTSLLYREPLCAQMPLHTGQLLHTEAFMPRCLHIPRSLDAQMLLHKDIAYAQMLLIRESFDTEAFTHRCFDTEKAFTHRRFCAHTHRSIYAQKLPARARHKGIENPKGSSRGSVFLQIRDVWEFSKSSSCVGVF